MVQKGPKRLVGLVAQLLMLLVCSMFLAKSGAAQQNQSPPKVEIKYTAIAGLTGNRLTLVVVVGQQGMAGRLVQVAIAPIDTYCTAECVPDENFYFTYINHPNYFAKRLLPGDTKYTFEIAIQGKGRTGYIATISRCGDDSNPSCDGIEVIDGKQSGVILLR